jgi:hypothetical protein
VGAARSPLGGELEGVALGATAPSSPAKGVREAEGEVLGVGEGENRPAANTAAEAARCTRKVVAESGTPRPRAVAEKSTAGSLKAHRSASSTTSSMGDTTVAAASSVAAAAADSGSGVGAASRSFADSEPVASSVACSAPSHASVVVRTRPSAPSCAAGSERGPGRFASEVREKAVSARRYVKAETSASSARKDSAEGVEVGEGVGVAVSVEVAVADVVAVSRGVPLPAAVPLTVSEPAGEPDADAEPVADFVADVEGSCVLVAVFEADAQRVSDADSEGVTEGCGEALPECVALGDADSEAVFVSVRVGVSVAVPHAEAEAHTLKEGEMDTRAVPVAFAEPEPVALPLPVPAAVGEARAEAVSAGEGELDSVPEVEGVTVSVLDVECVAVPEPVMEPLCVGEAEPLRAPVPDTLGLMVAVAHTVTVPVTVGEAEAVKLREVVTDSRPLSDWQGEGEKVVLPLEVLLAVTEAVMVMVGV